MPDMKLSVPLDKKLRAKLAAIAKKDKRSAGAYVAKLIEAHVEAIGK